VGSKGELVDSWEEGEGRGVNPSHGPDLRGLLEDGSTPTSPSQRAGNRVRDYSTLNRKKKPLSSEGNSMQILPSTTDADSGVTVEGVQIKIIL
tara:strand:- start:1121 stop:1399 length:279 start_codon:yes stop_codon:yes gene_type:complete